MEVSQIAGLDTHAIIGGGEAKSFRMAETAEFFEVLSNTLYRDKTLAVVREVSCNAWDSHIASGITDKPIKITVSDTELVIQDFGRGIPADKVGDIYCVYGASTKVKDENQTGGFGLGSKAPFAYADHFSVTTCHNGKKHLYAISRGGEETDGKPDFREMVCVDTEETGVRVSIPLKDIDDREMFIKLATTVITRGGMFAEINGREVRGYDYSKAKHGFCLVPSDGLRESLVYCLYGTVLYPVTPSDDAITDAMSKAANLFPNSAYRVVIIAPPNSVGVTPSRESLSYTDKTKATILNILTEMHSRVSKNMVPLGRQFVKQSVKRYAKNKSPDILLNWRFETHSSFETIMGRTYREANGFIWNADAITKIAASLNLNSIIKNTGKIVRMELTRLPETRDYRRLLRRRAHMAPPTHRQLRNYNSNPSNIDLFRLNSRLLARKVNKLDLLDNLYFFCHDGSDYRDDHRVKPFRYSSKMNHNTVVAGKNVFVSFNQRDAAAAVEQHRKRAKHRTSYDTTDAYPVLVLKRKQHEKIAAIKASMKELGFEVVEVKLTAPRKKVAEEDKVERTKLYHSLADHREGVLPKEETLESAKYFVRAQNGDYGYGVSGFGGYARELSEMFGDIAITLDANHEAKLSKDGAIPLWQALYDYAEKNKTNKLFLWTYGATKRSFEGTYREPAHTILSFCGSHHEFTKFFFPPPRGSIDTKQAKMVLDILSELRDRNHGAHSERNKKIAALLSEIDKESKKHYNFKAEREDLNKRFKAISCLQGAHYYADLSNEDNVQDLLALIKVLVSRQRKRDKIAEEIEAAAKIERDKEMAQQAREKVAALEAEEALKAKKLATPPAEIVKLDAISVNAPEKMKEIFTKFHALPSITHAAIAA